MSDEQQAKPTYLHPIACRCSYCLGWFPNYDRGRRWDDNEYRIRPISFIRCGSRQLEPERVAAGIEHGISAALGGPKASNGGGTQSAP